MIGRDCSSNIPLVNYEKTYNRVAIYKEEIRLSKNFYLKSFLAMSLPFNLDEVSSILYVPDSLEEVPTLGRRMMNPFSEAPEGSRRNPIDLTGEDEVEIIDLTESRQLTPPNTPVRRRIHPQPVNPPAPRNINTPPRIQGMVQLGVQQGIIDEEERNDIDFWLNTPSPTRPFVPANVIYRQNRGMKAFDKLVAHYCA